MFQLYSNLVGLDWLVVTLTWVLAIVGSPDNVSNNLDACFLSLYFPFFSVSSATSSFSRFKCSRRGRVCVLPIIVLVVLVCGALWEIWYEHRSVFFGIKGLATWRTAK